MFDLHANVVGYPKEAPDNMFDLVNMGLDALRELVKDPAGLAIAISIRKDNIEILHAAEKKPLSTAGEVRSGLEDKTIIIPPHAWLTYVLDKHRRRKLIPTLGEKGLAYSSIVTKSPPKRSKLDEKPLPDKGGYLLIFGGSPTLMSNEDITALRELYRTGDILDIIFWEYRLGASPCLYSVRVGVSSCGAGTEDMPFELASLIKE